MPENKNITVGVCTLGCRVNQYESRAIEEYLEARGAEISSFSLPCDFYIINTCAVTAESERKGRQMCRRAFKNNPDAQIVVTGCAAQLHPEMIGKLPSVKYICGNESKLDAARAVLSLAGKEDIPLYGKLELTPNYENYSVKLPDHTRAYVKIEDGCENKCAYCVIPKVRGPVRSKPFDSVMDEVRYLVKSGYREIVLTGIETCSYQYGLTELMKKMCEFDGLERIRLSSVNPAFINKKFTDSIVGMKKICPHFHLSLQSCCDNTLRAMRRRYNTKMLFENCKYLSENIPDVCFTADVICGFPGETDEDFCETVENISSLGLLHAHIFPYSKRPGTEAADMPDQIDENIKSERCARLNEVCKKSRAEVADGFVKSKKTFALLAETFSDGYLHGHSESFVPLKLKGSPDEVGSIIQVRMESSLETRGEFSAVRAD